MNNTYFSYEYVKLHKINGYNDKSGFLRSQNFVKTAVDFEDYQPQSGANSN